MSPDGEDKRNFQAPMADVRQNSLLSTHLGGSRESASMFRNEESNIRRDPQDGGRDIVDDLVANISLPLDDSFIPICYYCFKPKPCTCVNQN
jgi:hypothetical protein